MSTLEQPTGRPAGATLPPPKVSVVIPCLNEADNIVECVTRALAAIEAGGFSGEVVVADNNSTDGSGPLAEQAGARVVHESRPGYGSAYLAGFAAARGEYIVMADADLTYDFAEIPRFVAELDKGAQLVMGDRMDNIHPGAMPWLHRYVGNPVLTGILNVFFKTGVSDAHCGMRGFRRDILPILDLRTTGMEFASEMVIRASKEKLRIAEFPIEYHPRGGESKLSSFRDGWRHLRFLLVHSPTHLFMVPGLVLTVIGALIAATVIAQIDVFGRAWSIHTMVAGALLMIVGTQVIGLGLCAHAYGTYFMGERDPWFDRMRGRFRLEHGLALGGLLLVAGLVLTAVIAVTWIDRGFGQLSEERLAVLAAALLIMGLQVFFSSFLISILGLRRQFVRSARIVAGGVCAAAALLLGYYVLVPRDFYTGSNATRLRGTLIELNTKARELCLPGLQVPAGTGRVEFDIDTGGPPRTPMAFTLTTADGTVRSELPTGPPGRQKIAFDIPETPDSPAAREGRACVRLVGAGPVFFGGVPNIPFGEQPPTIDGEPTENRASIWYRPPAGERASVISQLPVLFERMALFRPGWVGTWTYWVLFLVVAPLLLLCGVRLIMGWAPRRLALTVGLLGFACAATWAHVTPTFNAPDESEHFAYVQSLAERGEPLDPAPTGRPTYSTHEGLLLTMTRLLDGNETADGKPPWLEREERIYRAKVAEEDPPRDDGGGFATAGSTHAPVFYALGVPAYLLAGDEVLDQLAAVRLVDALLGGLIAACAALIMLELAPRRRELAAAAGVAVAFQPMFSFIAGSYNNDMGVNAAAAVITLLLVRLLRRGWSWPTAIALGAMVGLAPLLKGTGYALLPPAALALALAAWRYRAHWRKAALGVAAAIGALVAVSLVWSLVSASIGRETFTTPGGGAPGANTAAATDITGTIAYMWETFLPRLPTTAEHWSQDWPAWNIFGVRGWGAFGWYAVTWVDAVYWVIMEVLVVLAIVGAITVARRTAWVRSRFFELLVLTGVVATVIAVLLAAYYAPTPQGDAFPQQGRYVFPAITAMAALFVLCTTGLGERIGGAVRVGLASAVVCLWYASLWLVLTRFYFAA